MHYPDKIDHPADMNPALWDALHAINAMANRHELRKAWPMVTQMTLGEKALKAADVDIVAEAIREQRGFIARQYNRPGEPLPADPGRVEPTWSPTQILESMPEYRPGPQDWAANEPADRERD